MSAPTCVSAPFAKSGNTYVGADLCVCPYLRVCPIRERGHKGDDRTAIGYPNSAGRSRPVRRSTMARKILMLVGDYAEDSELMLSFQALQMVGF